MTSLTYYGHSAFAIDTGSHTVLIDPFISGNPMTRQLSSAMRSCSPTATATISGIQSRSHNAAEHWW
jgi:L-ascorbate metabolism protein UlaG (beta-lactamase superfamily)